MGSHSHTVADALRVGTQRLRDAGSETPRLDAEVLLRHALGLDRTALFARLRESVDRFALESYIRLIDERARHVPVAYLIGEREFMGLGFEITPDVLIPRPETEILVEWALEWLKGRTEATVVDIGTGSGTIALSLAALLPLSAGHRIVATDVSAAALAVAARNRARLGLDRRVELRQGSLLAPILEPVDLLLANLPYLRPEQIEANPQLAAEPRLALAGGDDGLDLIRELIHDAPHAIAQAGAMALEIDPDQKHSVAAMARDTFPIANIHLLPDLAGLDRHLIVRL